MAKAALGLVGFCLLQVTTALAQEPLLRFQHIQPERSFTAGSIVDVTHDQEGFLWFASLYGGFARYDGVEFKTYQYDPDDPSGLAANATTCVYADPIKPYLWVCTTEGLARLNLESDRLVMFRNDPAIEASLPGNGVYRVLRDSQGVLWVGMDKGLARLTAEETGFIHYPLEIDSSDPSIATPSSWVWDIYEDHAGVLWIASTGGGLLRYDRKADEFRRFRHDPDDPSSLPFDSIRAIFEDSSGRLWVGTDRVAAVMSDRQAGVFEQRGLSALLSIAEDSHGNLWFSQRNGLSMLRPGATDYLHFEHDPADANGLGPGSIWQLHVGPQGNLWTPGNMVSWLPPTALAFSLFRYPEGHTGSAPAMTLDPKGAVWVGDMDGLRRLDPVTSEWQHWIPFEDPASERDNWVRGGNYVAPDGTYWVATNAALSAFDPSTGEFRPFDLPTAAQSMTMTRDGMLWLGLAFRGLARFDPINQALERYSHDPDDPETISHNFAYAVLEDDEGFLWVGTQQGLNRFERETGKARRYFSVPGEEGSLSSSTIRSGLLDARGQLWFGTEFGLNRYRPESDDFVRYFNGANPGDNVTYTINEDASGKFWIGTDAGMSLFDPSSGKFRNFTAFDGLPPAGFNNDLNLGDDGFLYALVSSGVLRINRDLLQSPQTALNLSWTGATLVNKDTGVKQLLTLPEALHLDHKDQVLTVGFSSVNLNHPDSVEYRYRLSGLQEEWIYPEPNRGIATFSQLPAGDYRLAIQARSSGGDWSEASLALPVSVSAPPWQSTWAYSFYALLLLGSFVGILQWRTRLLRIRSGALERAVQDRTGQLEESEAKVKRQAGELQELLELKDRLFANVSHEFRTPLTLMLGPIENARATTKNETVRSQLDMASRNGKRVLRLVDQLLELSRLESEQPVERAPHPVSGVAGTVTEAFRALARERGIQLTLVSDDQLWTEVPAYLMERLLMNLVSNALKYTESAGRVKVTTVRGEKNRAIISVEDTGNGIPADSHERVFERFRRVDEQASSVPGSGIGLALVHEIAEAYGGHIDLDSEVGRGTIVRVQLPAYTPPAGVSVTEELSPSEALGFEVDLLRHIPLPQTAKETNPDLPQVLIVEDNPDMRVYLETVLSSDYSVVAAVDGEQGIEFALELVPDLVICDLMMPRRDGFEVTKTLRTDQSTSHVPIIMLTARSDDKARLEGFREHVDDFLVKPFNEEELLLRATNLLAIRDIVRARYSADLFAGRDAKSQLSALDQRFLERLEGVLETHYQQTGFSVAGMATELAMSERQLQRKLKALTDQSPVNFLRIFRLNRSLNLLNEKLPIGQVALDVGFASPAHFSSCFRAQYGCTPSEFQQDPERIQAS